MSQDSEGFGETLLGFTDLSQFETDPQATRLLTPEYCSEKNVIILGKLPSDPKTEIIVGMVDPKNETLVRDLKERLKRPIRPMQLSFFDVRRAMSKAYKQSDDVSVVEEEGQLGIDRKIQFSPDQSPSKILDDILSAAIRRRATDIHFESYEDKVDLRFRVDGVLYPITNPLTPENIVRVISRIKVLCELDVTEKRVAQDGRFTANFREGTRTRRVDFRVSAVPAPYGQDVVIRILDPAKFVLDLDSLMPPGTFRKRYEEIIRYPSGLLLVTGPTGSGKTTTLYATVEALRGSDVKVVTAEDPVEYEFPTVNQKNVTEKMSFADYLRAFLRQDPDIILVGEIRDEETADIAVRAATTGHLVLSTLHTDDAISSVTRLRTLGLPNDYVAAILIGAVGQRLVRNICEECREETALPIELVPRFYQQPPQGKFFKGNGCPHCGNTGYYGMLGIFELFRPTSELSELIGSGAPLERLRAAARKADYEPLVEDGLRRVAEGITTLEEIARTVAPKFPV